MDILLHYFDFFIGPETQIYLNLCGEMYGDDVVENMEAQR